MKAVILAGGLGTRISEESDHGIQDFVICLGYKGYVIKEYSANYFLHMSDVTFDMSNNTMEVHQRYVESWRVTLVNTGEDTLTGGRLSRVREHLGDEPFCFTYGDGVADVDIRALIEFHKAHGKPATVTAIQPPGRYGALNMEGDRLGAFQEKPAGDGAWINGGFFVLNPSVIDYIDGDQSSWEGEPLTQLAEQNQLMAFRHRGFWQAMDTLRDKNQLSDLWYSGEAPWRVWS